MKELKIILNNMPNAYYGFVEGIAAYAKKKPTRLAAVKSFITNNPSATTSDVVKFVMLQPDFFEDGISEKVKEK